MAGGEERTSAAQGLQGSRAPGARRRERNVGNFSDKFQTQMPLRAVKGGGETDDDGGDVEFEWNQQDSGIKASNAGPLGNARSQSIVRAKGGKDLGKPRAESCAYCPGVFPRGGVCFDLLFFSVFGFCSHLPPQPTDSSPKRPPATCILHLQLHSCTSLPCGSCISLVSSSADGEVQWLWRHEIVPTRFGWDRVFRPLLYTSIAVDRCPQRTISWRRASSA